MKKPNARMNICRFETMDALSLWNTGKKLEKGIFCAYHVIELTTVVRSS